MLMKKAKAVRSSRRWASWDEKPLEGRQLMSAVPLAPQVHVASADAERPHGRVDASRATFVMVANRTDFTVRIVISEIDSYDWDGGSRPDHNLQGVVLAPGQSTTQREEINYNSYPHFNILLDDATTGRQIASARADYTFGAFNPDSISIPPHWYLNPEHQNVTHDGRALTFFSIASFTTGTGEFILANKA